MDQQYAPNRLGGLLNYVISNSSTEIQISPAVVGSDPLVLQWFLVLTGGFCAQLFVFSHEFAAFLSLCPGQRLKRQIISCGFTHMDKYWDGNGIGIRIFFNQWDYITIRMAMEYFMEMEYDGIWNN